MTRIDVYSMITRQRTQETKEPITLGVDISFGIKLIEAAPLVAGKSIGLMLGRQGLHVGMGGRRYFRQALRAANLPPDYDHYHQEDGFSETFLKKIGYPKVKSMDFSDYEACDYTHDLNAPVPKKLRDKFDVIIDGGTIEHVFNTPQALDNVFHMLKKDGIFISINGLTGWAGHGFYQFSPELVWRYWQDTRNCDVKICDAVSIDPSQPTIHVSDTGKAGSRFRGGKLQGRWYLYYVIQKTAKANPAETIQNIQQGDYAVRWDDAGNPDQSGDK